jgi:hypothetical protein
LVGTVSRVIAPGSKQKVLFIVRSMQVNRPEDLRLDHHDA